MPTTTISPQARIIALVGVLVLALAGSGFFLLSHHHATQAPVVTTPAPHHHAHHARTHPAVNPLLPARVRAVLYQYPLAVVGLYNPHRPIDWRAVDEARAGATAAHVGFVSVDVLDDAVAGPLTALLPEGQILPNPGFVIVSRTGSIEYRSDGYLVRALVTQAVKDSQ